MIERDAGASSADGVSVVVATKGRWALLRRAVEAVWHQDYTGEIELIIVVDGPLPAADVLPDASSDDRHTMRVVVNDSQPGLAGARNTGIAAAGQELIAFCDDDDVWRAHKLRTQTAILWSHEGTSVVGGGICVVHGQRRTDRIWPRPKVTLAELLTSRVMELHPSTFVMPTALLRALNGIDEGLPGAYAEDYDLLIRLAREGVVRMVQDVVADVYWQGQSFFFSRWVTIASALQYLVTKHPEFAEHPRGLARIYAQIAFAESAQGHRREAWAWSRKAVALSKLEPRLPLVVAVNLGLISADRLQRLLHACGRGI